MKRIIYRILLVGLLIMILFTIKSYGASDFSYTLDGNENATITAYNGSESNLTIPNIIDGHNVVAIGAHAFDESRNSTNGHTIKNLVISEGIERIGLLAFVKCTNLETVKLPESLTFLDMQAFLQCSNLKSINIPSKIASIRGYTFQETGFTEFDIPENVKSISSRALGICQNLEKVRVYSKDISYSEEVFYKSSNLVLYGYEGSTTQTYAQENGIEFKTLDSGEEEPPITTTGAIKLNKNTLSLKEEESETLTVRFIELSTSTKVIWTSSDEEVAIVENGKVTAKSVGNATITVSTENGQYKDTCTVLVEKKDSVPEPTVVPMTSVSLNKTSLSLYVGDSETLVATILPDNATDKKITWSSSNPNIATVENGKVVAKEVGETTITVISTSNNSIKASCLVTVEKKENPKEPPEKPSDTSISSISLNKKSLSLYVGNSETLVATILPDNATDKKITWSSSNPNIATVENGKVTAKAVGNTIITVSNADGTIKATCNVTAINKDIPSKKNPDNTLADTKLPQTGVDVTLIIVAIITISLFSIIIYKKYNSYKNIK